MMLKSETPSMCANREIGAIIVYSIVPSQRSQATISPTLAKTARRYAQTTVPMPR
jgi:hypothetical protein